MFGFISFPAFVSARDLENRGNQFANALRWVECESAETLPIRLINSDELLCYG
jgi:hypothetical protein